ncbi:hypothetical protein CRV01_05340 [Arcobacter sp. CECT 8983]|uniref:O-antigen ligase family protein n=1 Tax=Arcobacter sp. CECT 8983 TaxID=2044508 RepID=UPI00100A8E2B|nr:O-antigen ligase family protein [Arcobacter sp. CECT 8983]RXJ90579.1 hypothetical protein CRV01_05340 [Arcobacter sp. CECT 8983]
MINYSKTNWFLMYVYFYIFITPLHFSKSQLSVSSLLLLLLAIFKYKKTLLIKIKEYAFFTPISLFFAFILYIYLSTLWSNPFSEGLEHINTFYKYYFLFVPAILVSLNKEQAIIGIKVLIFSLGFYSIYSILIYLGFFNSKVYGFQSSNPTGHLRYLISTQYMVIAFFTASLFSLYAKSSKEKLIFLIVALLSFFALFINNSRTAQLSFLFIFIIFLIISLKKYLFNLKLILIFLIIVSSSINFLYQNNKLDRFVVAYNQSQQVFLQNQYNGSVGVRLYFNKAGIAIFKDDPLLGTGPKDNRIILQEIQEKDQNYNSKIYNHFHSEHIDILTAYGIIGYFLIFLSFTTLIYKLKKEPLYYYLSLAVFLCLFFNSFANKTLSVKPLNYVYILFFLLFAIIALKSIDIKKGKIENNS